MVLRESSKFSCRHFSQACRVSRIATKAANYTKAANMHLIYKAVDCSRPAAPRLYVEQYLMRRALSNNFFSRLHQRLAENDFFQRGAMNRAQLARATDIKENVLHQVQKTQSFSTRSLVISRFSVWTFSMTTKCIRIICSIFRHFNRVFMLLGLHLQNGILKSVLQIPVSQANVLLSEEASFTSFCVHHHVRKVFWTLHCYMIPNHRGALYPPYIF